jgi:hypothetical protein
MLMAGCGAASGEAPRTPVLLELFTSEGCSSCPPADALVARLVRDQPLPGVTVVALGFHVDYWDGLGWKDRFSSQAFTSRQQDYARAWNSDRIYTPQAVVNGRTEFIASSWPAAQRLLVEAAQRPLVPLEVKTGAPDAEGRVELEVMVASSGAVGPGPQTPTPAAAPAQASATQTTPTPAPPQGDLYVAVTEDDLTNEVRSGENARKTLAHFAVVRWLTRVGHLRGSARLSSTVPLDHSWRRNALRVVAFVQRPDNRQIVALGIARLTQASHGR